MSKQFLNHLRSVIFALCLAATHTHGANILAIMATFSPSHLITEMAVVRAMVERNHNVTVASILPLKAEWLHPNMTYVKLEDHEFDMADAISGMQGNAYNRFRKNFQWLKSAMSASAKIFAGPKFQGILKNRENKFDLILYGYLFTDFYFGVAEHFDCPVALIWPNMAFVPILNLIGSPLEMSSSVSTILNSMKEDTGFIFRLKNLFTIAAEWITFPSQQNFARDVYEKHFPSDKYVSFEKAKERVAMVLISHHFSEKPVRALVPGLIEIGGIHLNDDPKPLPKDIEDFVNSAEHGIIFFSLGTNIKANHLQDGALQKIFNVLSALPQKVLWKCDDEFNVPANSSNILYRNWLPQGDILGHPNVKLFFGHGGKGGITEAKFYGVPMVGLPLFADQPVNMEEVVRKGYGLSINHDETLTEEIIFNTIMEVLHNSTYTNNVKTFSKIYRDRPLKAKETAVYWLEYLIRHKGAPHLQSPLKTMSFIEKTNLDVILFLILIVVFVILFFKYLLRFILKHIIHLCKGKTKSD